MVGDIAVAALALFAFILLLTWYFHGAQKRVEKQERLNQKPGTLILLEDCYYDSGKSYNLISKDHGENWQVVRLFEEKPPVLLGPVEQIHPAILQNHIAWQELRQYTIQNGSIRLTDRRGARLLREAGFDVRMKR